MAIVVPDSAERYWLDRMVKGTNNGNNYTLKLYKALAGGLVEGTVIGDFTEAAFPGYAAKTLTPANFGAAATSTGTTSTTYSALQTFTCTGGGAAEGILGYYVIDATTGGLTYAEAFAATANIVNNGDAISVTPKIELA